MRENIHRKLLARLDEVSDERSLPARSDMYLADVQPIDGMKCNLLIGYDNHVAGPPQLSQVERFVESRWGGQVHAQTTTARLHEGEEAVSVLATINTQTRSVADAAVMNRIMAGTYMDEQTGHVWVVADNGESKYLMRRPDRDIDAVIGTPDRFSRRQARFEELRTAAAMLTAGDTVRFWDGAMPMVGKVSSLSGDQVSISANGKTYSVAREAVFNVVSRSESQISSDKNLLEDYWSRAVGNEEFGRKLTRKLNRQEDPLAGDTGWSGTVGLGD